MKNVLTLTLLLFIVSVACSQERIPAEGAIPFAEIMPQFPGGEKAMEIYLRSNSAYPIVNSKLISSGQNNVLNKVIVSFVVEASGRLTAITVENGPFEQYSIEALRLVRNMPRWKPASNNGHEVSMKMYLPIYFK
jgi:protein TonB